MLSPVEVSSRKETLHVVVTPSITMSLEQKLSKVDICWFLFLPGDFEMKKLADGSLRRFSDNTPQEGFLHGSISEQCCCREGLWSMREARLALFVHLYRGGIIERGPTAHISCNP